jgi:acyl carrier protein
MDQDRVRAVVANTLGVPVQSVTPQFGMSSSQKWDSLGHIRLIMAIEAEFGVRFRATEIQDLTSVEALVNKLAGMKGS